MNFEEGKCECFREIMFLFSFRIATQNDLAFFINEMNQSSSSLSLQEVSDYVKDNYLKGFQYAETELKEVPHLLMSLDGKYLKRSSNELLSEIKKYFYKKEYSETTKLCIKYNIKLFINNQNKEVGNVNYELLFYLYMFSILQIEENNFYIESATQMLNFNQNENISDFRHLLQDLKLKNIDKQIILNKLKENDTKNNYSFIFKFFNVLQNP